MRQIKQTVQSNKYSLISAISVIAMLCLIYIINGLAPFGPNVAMASDSFHQYVPLLSQLMDKIKEGDSLVYALSTGIGTSEIGNIINYMFSPLTWIILLFGQNNLEVGFGISVIIKASLSAFTFSYFLKKKTDNQDISNVIFSILYALSYYFLAYYWNVMWMDAVYMLPLIAYGIHVLIKEHRFTPYILALAYAIITNYYIGFMLCIGSVIYFIYEYLTTSKIKEIVNENEKNVFKKYKLLKSGVLFAIASIIAAGIACFALIPMYDVLASTSAVANARPSGLDFYSPIAVITAHLFGNSTSFYTNPTNTGIVPNVYCGILTLLLVPIMFMDKKISKKEKIVSIGVVVFFFISFCTNILNYLWHAGHYPNSLPYRFSYIYIFFLVYFGYKGYHALKDAKPKHIIITSVLCIAVSIISCFVSAPNISDLTVPVTVILFAIYGIIALLLNKNNKKWIPYIAIAMIVIEIIVPYATMIKSFESTELYIHTEDVEQMKETIEENGDVFYRADLLKHNMNMPGALYNYNSLSTFTSVSYETVSKLQMQLGTNCNGLNSVYYQPQGPIYNMMMSLGYLIDNDDNFELNNSEFELIKELSSGSKLYANKYKSSVAFSSATNLNETFDMAGTSPFDVQNKFASAIIGEDIKVMIPEKNVDVVAEGFDIEVEATKQGFIIKYTKNADDGKIIITTTASNDGYYYLTTQNALKFDHKTEYNGKELKKPQDIYPGSIGVGNINSGETFVTSIEANEKTTQMGEIYFYASYADMNAFDEFYNAVNNNGIANVLVYEDDYIKFDIDCQTNYIYTSIPYDKNWEVKVDGVVIDNVLTTSDALCLLEVEQGNHTIEFTYKQKSITTGFVISGISTLAFVAMVIIDRKRKAKAGIN